MARLSNVQRRKKARAEALIALVCVLKVIRSTIIICMLVRNWIASKHKRRGPGTMNPDAYGHQRYTLNRLVNESDTTCHEHLRVNRHTFMRLCQLLMERGLQDSRTVMVAEKVAMFLWIISHHTKNRRTKFHFHRSGETVSRHFNAVLMAVLRLHDVMWCHPQPILANEPSARWKWFENCLGALDGTYIPVLPPFETKARYRSRKGDYATNVLGVCDRHMQFVYALSGWEGSATDSRVLSNALVRPHGLKIPNGRYYLADAGYTNGPGILAPYRGQRYHTSVWREGHLPQSREEVFNMRHSQARNVIERCFGVLKMRWGILRSHSYYPIRTQCRIATACCLLQNVIKREMAFDPIQHQYNQWEAHNVNVVEPDDNVTVVETTDEWTQMRDELATRMYNEWQEEHEAAQ